MLSKAEIQYLQGQKQVSKSYERKLRCLIRKKVEVLQKELPFISSIFAGNIKSVFSEILNEKDGSRLASGQENIIKDFQYSINKNSATEFSNVSLSCDEIDKDHVVAREGLEGSKDSSNDIQISKATKFSNEIDENATKNSNSDEKRRRERDLNSVVILEETLIRI